MNKKSLFFILLGCVLLLTGCKNNVTKSNYDKIYMNMEKSEVLAILGDPDDTVMNLHNDEYYWFSEGRSIDEAFELSKKGKDVKYIIVVFSVELTNGKQIVLNKQYGNVSDILGDE